MSNLPHPLQRHHTLTETITFSSISFCSGYLWARIQSPKSPISITFLLCFAALARRYSCNRAEWSFKTRYEINTLKIKIYFWTRPTPLHLPLVYYEPSLWIHRIEKREGMTGLLIFFNSLFSSCALYDKVILQPSYRCSLWFPSEAVWGFNLKKKMNTGERERRCHVIMTPFLRWFAFISLRPPFASIQASGIPFLPRIDPSLSKPQMSSGNWFLIGGFSSFNSDGWITRRDSHVVFRVCVWTSLICPEGISTSGNAQSVRNSPESSPSGKTQKKCYLCLTMFPFFFFYYSPVALIDDEMQCDVSVKSSCHSS